MPRKDNSNIRRVTLRLDVSDPQQAAIWAHLQSLKGDASQWIRDTLAGDITAKVTAPEISVNKFADSVPFRLGNLDPLAVSITDVIKEAKGDSTPPMPETVTPPKAEPSPDKAKVTSPTPLPPGYGPRQKTSVFSSSVRPIPAFVGRKSE